MRTTVVIRILSLILTFHFAFDATIHVAEETVILEMETEKDSENKLESEKEIDKQTERHVFSFNTHRPLQEYSYSSLGGLWLNPTIEISDPPPEYCQFT